MNVTNVTKRSAEKYSRQRVKLSYVAADNRFSANRLEKDARNCRFSLSLPFICNLQTYGRLSSDVQSIGFTKHG